jgi:drug/metabolite transporter (DMT)-like permease
MESHLPIAIASTLCFSTGMVTSRVGLKYADPRAGAAISVPSAALMFLLLAPFTIAWSTINWTAVAVFAAVGFFYPAMVTLITFKSNEQLGPTPTSAIAGTAPLFAMLAAALFLDEAASPETAVAAAGVTTGIAIMLSRPRGSLNHPPLQHYRWPLLGALLRGLSQSGAKAGLLLWPNAFAASVVGYLVSAATLLTLHHKRPRRPAVSSTGKQWFIATGLVNGAAMILMYAALARAPVSVVAPIIAAYPAVTALIQITCLREARPTARTLLGMLLTVSAIVYLVSTPAPLNPKVLP